MLSSQIPTKVSTPWASGAGSGYIRTVPIPSQIGILPGAASFTDGFPPLNFLALGAGGVPPFGQDMNGVLNAITAWTRWQGAGGMGVFDSAFSAQIGGYPQGALVLSTTPGYLWLSIVDNNTTNPDQVGAAGWVKIGYWARLPYVADSSATPGIIVANFSPAITSFSAGDAIEVKLANTLPGATTINVNSMAPISVVRTDGSATQLNDAWIGEVLLLLYDGTHFQIVNFLGLPPLPKLTQPTNLYVNASTGSDTLYDGTSATISGSHGPFATIPHALTVMTTYDLNGNQFTINVADGTNTITAPIQLPVPNNQGLNRVRILGDIANPINCIIKNTGAGSCFSQALGGNYTIAGFNGIVTTSAVAAGDPSAIITSYAGSCWIHDMYCGASAGAHFASVALGELFFNTASLAGIQVAGSPATAHLYAAESAKTLCDSPGPPLTFIGSPTFGTAFAWATVLAEVRPLYASISGSAHGPKYLAQANAVINTNGQSTSYLPGDSAGTLQTGGQYV